METRAYWLDLFTGTTWQEFRDAGGNVSGFRASRWKTVQRMKPGDYLLCYLAGASRWIGVLEVVSDPFQDSSPIWKRDPFPSRVKVKIIAALTPGTAVPVLDMREKLSVFRDLKNPRLWSGAFRGSPVKWKTSDGEAVVEAVKKAELNPVERPIESSKFEHRPRALEAKIGAVTVPETGQADEAAALVSEPKAHDRIQWLLLKLGSDMGLDVWVARNDRNREWNGNRFSAIPRLRGELPLQFDEATMRTIELIDVLWLKGNAIVAAFEIESTTSIYSGLLRMGDLISMQPNLSIPLYLVAPDDRRNKVITEVNRPTFKRLSPPMVEMCRFIPFSSLESHIGKVGDFAKHLRPEFLDDLSESCEAEE